MLDQAFQLRQAFRLPTTTTRAKSPLILVLAGGGGGVGVTSLAAQLAGAMIWNGHATLLVDGDFDNPHLAERLGIEPKHTIQEALADRVSLHEALQRGPRGELLLPGAWDRRGGDTLTASAHRRLIDALRELGGHVGVVLIDAGHQRSVAMQRWAAAADLFTVVVSPDPAVVLDAYLLIKWLNAELDSLPRLGLLSPSAESEQAVAALERLTQTCWRFQRLEVECFGSTPETSAAGTGSPSTALLAAASQMCAVASVRGTENLIQSSDPL